MIYQLNTGLNLCFKTPESFSDDNTSGGGPLGPYK